MTSFDRDTNRRKSPGGGTHEFELKNVKIGGEPKEQISKRNWSDPQKPKRTAKERKGGSKDEEEL